MLHRKRDKLCSKFSLQEEINVTELTNTYTKGQLFVVGRPPVLAFKSSGSSDGMVCWAHMFELNTRRVRSSLLHRSGGSRSVSSLRVTSRRSKHFWRPITVWLSAGAKPPRNPLSTHSHPSVIRCFSIRSIGTPGPFHKVRQSLV